MMVSEIRILFLTPAGIDFQAFQARQNSEPSTHPILYVVNDDG